MSAAGWEVLALETLAGAAARALALGCAMGAVLAALRVRRAAVRVFG